MHLMMHSHHLFATVKSQYLAVHKRLCTIPVTDKTDDVKARVQKDAEDAKLTKAVASHVAIEDSGRCVIEAENGTAVSSLDAAGWKLIY